MESDPSENSPEEVIQRESSGVFSLKKSLQTTSLAGPQTLDETESPPTDYIDENILKFSHEIMGTDCFKNG